MRVIVQRIENLTNFGTADREKFLQGMATAINQAAGTQMETPVIHRKARGKRYLGTLQNASFEAGCLTADLTTNNSVTAEDLKEVGIEIV